MTNKKILYLIHKYDPKFEAIAKEVEALHNFFPSKIFSTVAPKLKINKNYFGFPVKKLPFLIAAIPFLERKFDISHIYASLGNRLYVSILKKKPVILTSAGAPSYDKTKKYINLYKRKLDKIIVECDKDKAFLLSEGFDDDAISVIYPGTDLRRFHYTKPEEKFTILFASSPLSENQFKAKGVLLLKEVASDIPDVEFILLWRNYCIGKARKLFRECSNVKIINGIFDDITYFYNKSHLTIYPALTYSGNKPCPNSIIESLASGKPVAVSSATGIASLIKKEKCGEVFAPVKEDVIKKIGRIKEKYKHYQSQSRKVAEKYFSHENFIKQYEEVYNSL